MKVVNADWEKRNLGIDVTEIQCAEKDSPMELSAALNSVASSYSVLKVPSGFPGLLFEAQRNGYKVVEMSIELWGDMRNVSTPALYSRFVKYVSIQEAKGEMLDRIMNEILRGDIFISDRIATDPCFSLKIAGQRYYNWAKDVLDAGGFMALLYYKGHPVAFNLSVRKKENPEVFDGILGGLLSEANKTGLGFLTIYGGNEVCRMHDGKRYIARVSSNNMPILRLHLQYGYEVKNMTYVLVKHQL